MGNSQLEQHKNDMFIRPKKVQQNQIKSRIVPDLHTQLEQIFGVADLPISHRALPPDTPKNVRQLFDSACVLNQLSPSDKQYEQRIANLEQELHNLKHVIENITGRKEKSRVADSNLHIEEAPEEQQEQLRQEQQEEPEIAGAEPQYHQINASVSHVSQTYFRSPSRNYNPTTDVDSRTQVNPSQFSPMSYSYQ